MDKLYIKPAEFSPEINFSPEDNIFIIRGISSPGDVRALYYPVIEWIRFYVDELIKRDNVIITSKNPFKFQVDMSYFNSSSAKFIYDIFFELNRLKQQNIPVVVEWHYEEEDIDMKEAGADIALLAEMEFTYIPKKLPG
jgi:hypothetical protein